MKISAPNVVIKQKEMSKIIIKRRYIGDGKRYSMQMEIKRKLE